MEVLTLVGPPFKQEVQIELEPKRRYLIFGPFALLSEGRDLDALKHLFLSIITLGGYWIYFYRKNHFWYVVKLLNMGFVPKGGEDKLLLQNYNLRRDYSDNGYIGISRSSSVDHSIGPSAKDFEVKRYDK